MSEGRTGDDGRALEGVNWAVVVAIGAAVALWLGLGGFALEPWGAAKPGLGILGSLALMLFYRRVRVDERIAATFAGLAQILAFSAGAATLSYLAAGLGHPLWDGTLHAWDRALGLDWPAYLAFVDARPALGQVLTLAYQSLLPQMMVILAALGLTGRLLELRVFVAAVMLSGLVCVLVSGAMPAMAYFVHLGLGPADYPNLAPAAGHVHVAHMEALRAGTLRVIDLDAAEGIITFPSYHAALGAIFAAALWTMPRLRWPGLALNLALIAATPIDGGHYFVDVLAGLALAALCLLAARALAAGAPRRLAPSPALAPTRAP